jgi:hypothetical protein
MKTIFTAALITLSSSVFSQRFMLKYESFNKPLLDSVELVVDGSRNRLTYGDMEFLITEKDVMHDDHNLPVYIYVTGIGNNAMVWSIVQHYEDLKLWVFSISHVDPDNKGKLKNSKVFFGYKRSAKP